MHNNTYRTFHLTLR